MHLKRPFVTANFAITMDGRIATGGGGSSGLGSRTDFRRLLEIRASCDAILAGARTVVADNMTMGIPAADLVEERILSGRAGTPFRVIVSNSGKLNPKLKVFQQNAGRTIVFSTQKIPSDVKEHIARNAELFLFDGAEVNLPAALSILRDDFKIKRIVCEGGGRLLRALLDQNLVDEINVTLCPRIFGGKKVPTLSGIPGDFLPASVSLQLIEMKTLGNECFTRWKVKKQNGA